MIIIIATSFTKKFKQTPAQYLYFWRYDPKRKRYRQAVFGAVCLNQYEVWAANLVKKGEGKMVGKAKGLRRKKKNLTNQPTKQKQGGHWNNPSTRDIILPNLRGTARPHQRLWYALGPAPRLLGAGMTEEWRCSKFGTDGKLQKNDQKSCTYRIMKKVRCEGRQAEHKEVSGIILMLMLSWVLVCNYVDSMVVR